MLDLQEPRWFLIIEYHSRISEFLGTDKHLEIFHPLLLRSRVPCKFGGAALSIKTTKGGLVHTLGMWGKGGQVSYNTWRLDSQAPPETKKLHNYPPEHSYSFARSQAATRCRNQDSKNSQASKKLPRLCKRPKPLLPGLPLLTSYRIVGIRDVVVMMR